MARSEARLQFDIWQTGLRGHTAQAKLVYAVLLTEPTLNHAGVGALRVSRWAREASLTVDEVEEALTALSREGQVVIDLDTEELLVRTLIRRDEVYRQPYLLKGALKVALLTRSPRIRRALAGELRKLPSLQGRTSLVDPTPTAEMLDPAGDGPEAEATEPDPFETLFEVSKEGLKTQGGRGRGGGGGSASGVASSKKCAARLTDAEASVGFDDFYAAYPRRKDRLKAEKAWRAARRRGVSAEQLISAGEKFAEEKRNTEAKYIPYPASWLNAGSYENESESARLKLVHSDSPWAGLRVTTL